MAQGLLVTLVARHWADILQHYRKSRISASHPRFLRNKGRAACIPSMQPLHERKILESAGYRYMLRTDVSRFFPTIYTHSIPWAFHSKAQAKARRRDSTLFGNLIDTALRQGQDQQTMGIPIGPDTSHIIAEAIATSIDELLKNALGNKWPAGFRFVDDYFLFFSNVASAESALASLSQALKEYELQVNFEKTRISPVSEILEDYWTHELRRFAIDRSGRKQRSDIHHFFELAKQLAMKNSDENVMTYALKRAASVLIKPENWTSFESHLCHVALFFPNTLQTVAQILATYRHHGYQLGTTRIARTLNSIVKEHAPLEHHSEVAWCLWICKELDLKLESENVSAVAGVHSSVCALLLMDLSHSGKLDLKPPETFWRSVDTVDGLKEEFWLMCYEAGRRGWGGFTSARITADAAYFNYLGLLGVTFYNETATSKLLFEVRPGTLKKLDLTDMQSFFERDDADDFLEYDDTEGGYEGVAFEEDEEFKDNEEEKDEGEEVNGVDDPENPHF